MKHLVLTLSLGFSSLAMAGDIGNRPFGDYRLSPVASEDLAEAMPVADAQSAIPAPLQGLWWMDGNPLPDEFVSFAHSAYDVQSHKVTINVYDQDIWSWHGNEQGSFLYDLVQRFKLTYELTLNEEETFIQIIPVITFKGIAIHVPRALVNFTARADGDGRWIRESQFFGQEFGSYTFRRVVDRNGVKDQDVFDAYLQQAPKNAYLAKKVK